jgi:uncharacterized protein (DUF433 family)
MTLAGTLVPKAPPLREDADGVVRIGDTRVTLDTVIAAYWGGMTAEEIVCAFDALSLADVHAVLGYYLQNREAVDTYLAEEEREAQISVRKNEARSSWK